MCPCEYNKKKFLVASPVWQGRNRKKRAAERGRVEDSRHRNEVRGTGFRETRARRIDVDIQGTASGQTLWRWGGAR